jgi:Polyketide cyclase / dehydrase and lipid transport
MAELSVDLIIAAPAGRVWDVIGRRFDRIGEWATAIPASIPVAGSPAHRPTSTDGSGASLLPVAVTVDAPVGGRVCRTGIRLVPEVTEILTAYDDATRSLTYLASGMPAFVTLARNTWTVIPIDPGRCMVTVRARFDTRGIVGLLGRWAILAQTRRTSRYLADDLRHYVETGAPSPRKQRQLRRSGRPPGDFSGAISS